MRLFIALEPPPELQQRISELIEPLKRTGADVKWVRQDQLHFTLKFLGEVEEPTGLEERLAHALRGAKRFEVRIQGLGYFGEPPRVLWLGVREGQGELLVLMQLMNERFADIRREDFEPVTHLTVGRVNGAQNRGALREALRKLQELGVGSFTAREVLLKKSTLAPEGPVYETVVAIPLEAA